MFIKHFLLGVMLLASTHLSAGTCSYDPLTSCNNDFDCVDFATGETCIGGVPANNPPVASNVSVTGTLQENQTIDVSYTYFDADTDPEIGTTFKWFACTEANASTCTIQVAGGGSGITTSTYTLQNSDVGKYMQVYVYPNDGQGVGTADFNTPPVGPVTAVGGNTTPTITVNDTPALAYLENDAATQIESAATTSDADGDAEWDGGTLSVQITANAEASDEISISDTDADGIDITINTTNILANGTDIGDLSSSGGVVTNNTTLTITFDADATNAMVQEVLQSIRFRSSSENPSALDRTVTFTVTDKNSASANATRTISVTALNDVPTLTAFSADVATTQENTEVEITFAELNAQGDEADVDGTVDAYVVQAVSSGILNIGTSSALATPYAANTNDTIDATKNAYWTPAAGTGSQNAFTLKAKDDALDLSSTAVQAKVKVIATAQPVIDSRAPTIISVVSSALGTTNNNDNNGEGHYVIVTVDEALSNKIVLSGSCWDDDSSIEWSAYDSNGYKQYKVMMKNTLADGAYKGCTLTVYDKANNAKSAEVEEFTIDTVVPTIMAVSFDGVNVSELSDPYITSKTELEYVFNSSEDAEISAIAGCKISKENEIVSKGDNTIVLTPISGLSRCVIIIKDRAGNNTDTHFIPSFELKASLEPAISHYFEVNGAQIIGDLVLREEDQVNLVLKLENYDKEYTSDIYKEDSTFHLMTDFVNDSEKETRLNINENLDSGYTYNVTFFDGRASITSEEPIEFNYTCAAGHEKVSLLEENDGKLCVKQLPIAVADTAVIEFGKAVSIDVLANDTPVGEVTLKKVGIESYVSPSDDPDDREKLGLPVYGSASVYEQKIDYIPEEGFSGEETFSYVIQNSSEETATATVKVTVCEENEVVEEGACIPVALTAKDLELTTQEDTNLTIDFAKELKTDETVSIVVKTNPENGKLTKNTEGNFTYTPAQDYNGSDSFTYTLNDAKSEAKTLSITVTPVNDAPKITSTPKNEAQETTTFKYILTAEDIDNSDEDLNWSVKEGTTLPDWLKIVKPSKSGFVGNENGISAESAFFVSLSFSEDIPYVAFGDKGKNQKLFVKKLNGTQWDFVGDENGISEGSVYFNSLAISKKGNPYVAFGDKGKSGKLIVKKLNGTQWDVIGDPNGISEGYIYGASLAFSEDIPYVAFTDYGKSAKLIVKKLNGTQWDVVGDPNGISERDVYFNSLAFSEDGNPYIAFSDNGKSGKLIVKKLNGTQWDVVGDPNGISEGNARYVSLSFSKKGIPYVAFTDEGKSGKLFVKKLNGTQWDVVGDANGISESTAYYSSLAFSEDGNPYVAFRDEGKNQKLFVKKLNGTQWDVVGDANGISESIAYFSSLAISKKGNPYVAFTDYGKGAKLIVKKLIDTPFTTLEGIPPSGTDGVFDINISVSDAEPLYDHQNFKLSVKKFDGKNPDTTSVVIGELDTKTTTTAPKPPELEDAQKELNTAAPARVISKALGYSRAIDSFDGEAGYRENIYGFNGVGVEEYSDEQSITRMLTYTLGLDGIDLETMFNTDTTEEYDENTTIISQIINAYNNGTQEIIQSGVFTQTLLTLMPGSVSDYSAEGITYEQSDLAEIISSKIFLGTDGNASADITFSSENRFMLKTAFDNMRYLVGEYSLLAEYEEVLDESIENLLVRANKEAISFEASNAYTTHTRLREVNSTLSGSVVDVDGTTVSLNTPECNFASGAKAEAQVSNGEDNNMSIKLKLENKKGKRYTYQFSNGDITTVNVKGGDALLNGSNEEIGTLEFNEGESATIEMTLDDSFTEFSYAKTEE